MTSWRSARPDSRALRHSRRTGARAATLAAILIAICVAIAFGAHRATARTRTANDSQTEPMEAPDSAVSASVPDLAPGDTQGIAIVVSLADRALWVVKGRDTVLTASVGVGMDSTLVYRGRVWNFHTPRGHRRILSKEANPTWAPPDWHYVEMARARGLRLARIPADHALQLRDGSRILLQDGEIGLERPGVPFTPFAIGEEIIWDSTLFIPPLGSRQRQVAGELGRFRLDIGDGYLLHGTPYHESIGQPSSHGCIRLADDDVAWLYRNVPVGAPVIIR